MKKFALFVAVAVGLVAAWEVSRQAATNTAADTPPDGEMGPPEPPIDLGDSIPAPAPVSIVETVVSFFKPVEDVVITIKRAAFGTPYDDLIFSSAKTYNIPPEILYKLLNQESRFRPDIIEGRTKSPVGALGIAQFMPATAVEELGSTAAALDPAQAIPGAARYLSKLRGMLGGDIVKAVAAYNWGVGNVKRKGLAAAPRETKNYAMAITGVNIAA